VVGNGFLGGTGLYLKDLINQIIMSVFITVEVHVRKNFYNKSIKRPKPWDCRKDWENWFLVAICDGDVKAKDKPTAKLLKKVEKIPDVDYSTFGLSVLEIEECPEFRDFEDLY
jgi:hypothetical protein